ncbi:MAG: zinc ribbon domain-containing protein [Pseudobutyrivibrio sp.]|nr:zinc ribbon domain-containing protein [Pseudobutyrivibrio sp.]
MFLVYGTTRKNKEIANTNTLYQCNHCKNVSRFMILRNRLYFTLFFIPLIPLSSHYYEVCPICERGHQITKAEAYTVIKNGAID